MLKCQVNLILHQLLIDIPSSLPQPIVYITLMLHLEVYPFLQVLQFAAVWVVVSPDKYYLAMK
jgi:hypothetical protein